MYVRLRSPNTGCDEDMKRISILMLIAVSPLSFADSLSCGGTNQPRCEVTVPVDQATSDQASQQQNQITQMLDQGKSLVQDIPDDKFQWTFIPQIPTADCSNPQVPNPVNGVLYDVDVCSSFNTFKTFINGVLAFFCILGCVQQIRAAMAVKG
jgi:hypothetical protein